MIVLLFYVLCAFAAVHFIYERIVQPSIRLHFRNQLFSVRDAVRNEIISGDLDKANLAAANLIHQGLNNTINRLHLLTLGNKFRAQKKFENDQGLRDRIKKNALVLEDCSNTVLKQAMKQSLIIMDKSLICNNFLFLLYSWPIFLSLYLIGMVIKTVNSTVTSLSRRLWKAKEFEQSIMLMNEAMMEKVVYA